MNLSTFSFTIILFAAALIISAPTKGDARSAGQKFYSLDKARQKQQKPVASNRFIPLSPRRGGRVLKFMPLNRSAITSRQHMHAPARAPKPHRAADTKVAEGAARQLLSIYESVD